VPRSTSFQRIVRDFSRNYSARGLTVAIAALFFLTFALVACQVVPSDDRATSGETSAAAPSSSPSRDAQPRSSDTRAASGDRYDLSRDEQRGGHTLDKHVGRSDDQLRERLDRERDISAASTWTDLSAAEETVAAAIRANQNKIDRWNDRGFPRANLALHFDAGHDIGRTMRHGETSSEPCSSAVVVLKADRSGGFFVLTTYPEARE
jgi:Bacterial CdiA-CT RNAse A domain